MTFLYWWQANWIDGIIHMWQPCCLNHSHILDLEEVSIKMDCEDDRLVKMITVCPTDTCTGHAHAYVKFLKLILWIVC